jgi:lipid-binding SYLF domain-containing protein
VLIEKLRSEVAMKIARALPVLLLLVGVAGYLTPGSVRAADDKREIDAAVDKALPELFHNVKGSQELAKKASGILVFPEVYKAAVGVGGEYGKGALRVGGKTAGYYSITSGSLGLQLGAEARDIVFMFMSPAALADFQKSSGWQAGASAGVTLVKQGAEESVDTKQIDSPVLAFVFGNTGLMADASVEGTKISKLE